MNSMKLSSLLVTILYWGSSVVGLPPPLNQDAVEPSYHANHAELFIVNGQPSSRERWPWMVSIQRQDGVGNWYHTCGGTLISTRHVLTAGHCMAGSLVSDFRVVVGVYNLLLHDEVDIIPVAVYNTHPAFELESPGTPNDISVLSLVREAPLGPYVQVATMAEPGQNFTGTDCILTGWGKLKGTNAVTSPILMEVSMPCISNLQCQMAMWNVIGGRVYDSHICVMDRDRLSGSCSGDSGGPMHCREHPSEPWVVAGVTSWGVGFCPGTHPSVYTRVSYFRQWIDSIVSPTATLMT